MATEYSIFENMSLAGKITPDGRMKILTVDPTELTPSDKDEVFNCGFEHLLCSPQHKKLYPDILKLLKGTDLLTKDDFETIATFVQKEDYTATLEAFIPRIKSENIFCDAKVADVASCDSLLEIILQQWKDKVYSIEKWLKAIDLILLHSKEESNFPNRPLGLLFQYVNPNLQNVSDIHEAALLLEIFIKYFPTLTERDEGDGWTFPIICMYKQNATLILACFDDKCKLPFDINDKIKSLCGYGDLRVRHGTLLMGTFHFFKNKSLLLTLLRQLITNPKLDVNARDELGNTAAAYAGISLDPQAFQMIINHKDFDFTLKNNLGETLEEVLKHRDVFYYDPDLAEIFTEALKSKEGSGNESGGNAKVSELLQQIKELTETAQTILSTASFTCEPDGDLRDIEKVEGNAMSEKDTETLKQHRDFLCEELSPLCLLDHLKKEGILTEDAITNIRKEERRRKMVEYLLRVLPNGGNKAFGVFCKALKKESMDFILGKLVQ